MRKRTGLKDSQELRRLRVLMCAGFLAPISYAPPHTDVLLSDHLIGASCFKNTHWRMDTVSVLLSCLPLCFGIVSERHLSSLWAICSELTSMR